MTAVNEDVVRVLNEEILRSIKELLETKHLYQSVRVDYSPVQKMLDGVATSPQVKELQGNAYTPTIPHSGSSMPSVVVNIAIKTFQQEIKATAESMLEEAWSFATYSNTRLPTRADARLPYMETPFKPPRMTLPTISVPCAQCDAVCPPHNSGYRGQNEDVQSVTWQKDSKGKTVILQTFVFPYQCQACKKEPLIFLVHREGSKLILTGRNHFEIVQSPKTIPAQETDFFRDAIVASNTGNVLPGLFLLRTTIEQYMRRILSVTGKKAGDELADAYAALLDDEFPKHRYPSLKTIYDELSAKIHGAEKDVAQFEKSRNDIEKHFDLLKHFPLKK